MSIKFVPGQGWVTDGGFNVSAGSPDIAYLQEQRGKKDAARRAVHGQYDQYMGQDNLDWLKQNVGDSWWWSGGRLPGLANDSKWFWKEFGGRSDESYARNAEIVNRYRALEESGMDRGEIYESIFGNSNLSPTFQNSRGGVTGSGMLSGGGNDTNNAGAGGGNSDELDSWQSMLNPNNDVLKNLLYGNLKGMLGSK